LHSNSNQLIALNMDARPDRCVAGVQRVDGLRKLDDYLSKLLWLCASSTMSVVIALSGSPAYAEKQFSILDDFSSNIAQDPLPESDALLYLNLAENPVITNSDAGSNQAPSEIDLITGDNETVPDMLPQAFTPTLPAALEEAVHSAESLQPLTQPASSSAESALESANTESTNAESTNAEPTEPASLNPIAQAADRQPAAPSSEPQSEPEPASEPASEPEAAESSPASRGWQFSVEPYFFAPFDVDADVTVLGRSTSLDLGLDDVLELDRAFDAGLRLEARNNRWSVILDGFYLYAENSGSLGGTFSSGSLFQFVQQTSPDRLTEFAQQFEPEQIQQFIQIGQQIGLNTPINVSADGTVAIRQITVDAAVSYRALDVSLNRSQDANFYPRLTLAPMLGVRTNFLKQTIEIDAIRINDTEIPDRVLPSTDREFRFSRTLVEPLVGAQLDLALSPRWAFGLRGDLSGFNIGADQNLTWNLLIGTQYNVSRNVALRLAYRFNSFDFEDGEGLSRTRLELRQNGLLLSAIFQF
jgi:opacity protein-like surface antigen